MVNNERGILIHQLPLKYGNRPMAIFRTGDIEQTTHDSSGLRVYFKKYESAKNIIVKGNIQVDGISYIVYPLFTCLTVSGIPHSETDLTIKDCMKSFGPIASIYQVSNERTDLYSKVDDYRVILDIAEVFSDLNLSPISLPKNLSCICPVGFYCRLCRKTCHKQYQCPKTGRHGVATPELQYCTKAMSSGTNACSTSREKTEPDSVPRSNPATQAVRQNLNPGCTKEQESEQKQKPLSKEFIEIISTTKGVLHTPEMLSLLQHVRRKKHVVKVAEHYSSDIAAIVRQLRRVECNYYKKGWKTTQAERDVKFIDSLCNRLLLQAGIEAVMTQVDFNSN